MHAPSLSFAAAVVIPIVVVVVATTGVVWPYTKVRVWKNKKICFCSTNPFTTEKSGFLFFSTSFFYLSNKTQKQT